MASTPTPPPAGTSMSGTVGEQVRAQFEAARQLVHRGIEQLVHVYGAELAELMASLTGLGAVVEAACAAVVLEAHSRGVIAESDNPRLADWVRQAAVDAQVPFNKPQAAQLQAVTAVCAAHDLRDLRSAIVEGRLPLNALAAPSVDEHGVPDGRTAGQRRADALVTMATMAANTDPTIPATGVKARITVTAPLADLQVGLDEHCVNNGAGAGPGCGFSGFGHALTPAEVRMLACDAGIIPAIMGTESEILDLGREVRRITPGQRAALHLRDKGCTFPGCTAPPAWCDGHHIRYWRFDGRTDMKSLSLLCRHHHTEVHRRNHTATIDDHGGVHWTRGDGTPIGNTPRWEQRTEQYENQHRHELLPTT